MRHVFGVMLLVALCSGLGAVTCRVAVGVDAGGETVGFNQGMIGGFRNTLAPTYSFLLESKQAELTFGLGADYQFARKNQKLPGNWKSGLGEHYYIPVYGSLNYSFPTPGKISPEVIAQLGYNFPQLEYPDQDDDERYIVRGGVYTGLGMGLCYQNYFLNVLYRVDSFSLRNDEFENNVWIKGKKYQYQTQQYNVSLGLRFGNTKK